MELPVIAVLNKSQSEYEEFEKHSDLQRQFLQKPSILLSTLTVLQRKRSSIFTFEDPEKQEERRDPEENKIQFESQREPAFMNVQYILRNERNLDTLKQIPYYSPKESLFFRFSMRE